MTYWTDGFHLYEEIGRLENFGRLGGSFLRVRDASSGAVRLLGLLEQALCRPVG